MPRFPDFTGAAYEAASKNVDAQRLVNLFPELNESGTGKEGERLALRFTDGLDLLCTPSAGAGRGSWVSDFNEKYFIAVGNKVYEVSSSWAATELGTLTTTTGYVSMADNGTYLAIVDGTGTLYLWNMLTSTWSTKTDSDNFLGATHVVYQDGYFIFNNPDTGQFYITALNDVTIDALDIATAEGNPDNLVSHLSDHRELWLFGQVSTEVFFNSGNADFPFERIQGAFIEYGCAAAFSPAKLGNTTFWLGKGKNGVGTVCMAVGYQPKRVSTHAIEIAIQSYGDISDARGFAYERDGHAFYQLTFPTASKTWVFDATTELWHERAWTYQGGLYRHRAECHSYAHSKHVVLDWETGKVYELSRTKYSDNGDAITRMRTAPHLSSSGKRVQFHSFELDIETGVGLDGVATTQGNDPQIMLTFSDDGGHTWSNEKWVSFGKIGNRHKRPIWRRLGASRDRVFCVKITDPVPVTILGANIEMEALAS